MGLTNPEAGSKVKLHPVSDRRETEFQFVATSLPRVERWILANVRRFDFDIEKAGNRQLQDTYLDNARWQIFRAGYKLRSRRAEDRSELTFKALTPGASGSARDRREISQVVPRPDADPLKTAKGLVADWLNSLAGRVKPMRLFGVSTLRTTYLLKRHQRPIAEIALDECQIEGPEQTDPARVHFVEVEGDAPALAQVRRFLAAMTRECGLKAAQLSKFGLGLSLNRLQPDGLPAFDPIEFSPALRIRSLALNVLRTEFLQFLQREAGTRLGEDAEELHQMRVACRRLRAALRLFEDFLPRQLLRSQDTLQWVGAALGAVRDFDVKLDQLRQWRTESEPGSQREFDRILKWGSRHRTQARRRMIRVLDSRRYALLVRRLELWLSRPVTAAGRRDPPAAQVLPELIRPLYKRVLKAGSGVENHPVPETYHRLRIRCRSLRYALEFASRVCGPTLDGHRKRLVRLQDALGRFNDTVVARTNIRSWVHDQTKALPPRAVFLLGTLEERLRAHGEASLTEFPDRFRTFKKRSWRSLQKALKPD